MDQHTHPYLSLFKKYVPDLSPPDSEGWASGRCPFCGEPDTFQVNLKSGRWVCLPTPVPHHSIRKEAATSRSERPSMEANKQ